MGVGVIAFISLWASQLWILAMVLLGVSMCAGVSGCLFTVGVHTDSSFGVGASFVCVWGGGVCFLVPFGKTRVPRGQPH